MPASLSLGLAIVQVLRQYRRLLPIDFVAQRTGHTSSEVRRYLAELEHHQVALVLGDNVRLAS